MFRGSPQACERLREYIKNLVCRTDKNTEAKEARADFCLDRLAERGFLMKTTPLF